MTDQQDSRIFTYQIDSRDVIIKVNDEWLSFAVENSGNLTHGLVVNKVLWDFVADMETQHLYKVILEKVRMDNANIKVPLRCDSPDCRRFMELEIYSPRESYVEFRSRITRLEFRPAVEILDSNVDRSGEFVNMCSWCKKIQVSASKWLEVEEAIRRLDLFGAVQVPQLSHTMCPGCKENISQVATRQVAL